MSTDSLLLIAPLLAAVLTAAAILIVDLIWPGRSPFAIATALIGLGVTAAVTVSTGQNPGSAFNDAYTAFGPLRDAGSRLLAHLDSWARGRGLPGFVGAVQVCRR